MSAACTREARAGVPVARLAVDFRFSLSARVGVRQVLAMLARLGVARFAPTGIRMAVFTIAKLQLDSCLRLRICGLRDAALLLARVVTFGLRAGVQVATAQSCQQPRW